MRILVVDDRFESRWGLADWLVAFLEAVAVESAASAPEALQAIERRMPDVVLVTHPLLGIGDLDLARRIKALPVPPLVVLMTDHHDAGLEAACEAASVDFWLEKRHLQARLFTFLQQHFTLKFIPTRLFS
jgi:two-component system, LytTR family, response regulator AlgR